jgi:hypothetical protein
MNQTVKWWNEEKNLWKSIKNKVLVKPSEIVKIHE